VRELAINPLLLTVIALVHRDRVKLPDRRAELYEEAVDVLLGKWDEAKEVAETRVVHERPFDTSDRRLVLQRLALWMHEERVKEVDRQPLRELLADELAGRLDDTRDLDAAVDRLLRLIEERTGLLIARGEGSYAFSHLTFQEYLAALGIAGRDDYVEKTLAHSADPWWREVILLTAGHLSTQSRERTTRLIRAIADARAEPEPYHNLVLAAECVRDAGSGRLIGNLEAELRARLRDELERPEPIGWLAKTKTLLTRGIGPQAALRRRIAAASPPPKRLPGSAASASGACRTANPSGSRFPPENSPWARAARRTACRCRRTPSRACRSATRNTRCSRRPAGIRRPSIGKDLACREARRATRSST